MALLNIDHGKLERNVALLGLFALITVAIGGLVQITPLFWIDSTIEKVDGMRPYTPLEQAGRNIYIREGCYVCHSQMIRPFRDEVERYGPYSLAAESMYDHPFQWGSKRTGPDLARVGGRYSDEWHRIHFRNPRDVVPESNMPAYPYLQHAAANAGSIQAHMRALRRLGVPYTEEEITNAPKELEGKTEEDALIAYMQGLGIHRRSTNTAATANSAVSIDK
jgi:cytochrome c oxidase cbb3-type subunit 2